MGLMTEVRAGFDELLHGDDRSRHNEIPLPVKPLGSG
jgi:hypothetical protein